LTTRQHLGITASAAALLLTALGAVAQSPAPARQKTVLDGVFTEAQVARGEALYKNDCAECHEEGGAFDGASLEGPGFMDRWREDSLDTLYTYIRKSMPEDMPGEYPDKVYRDVLAYLLNRSGIPAGGQQELTDDVIRQTLLVGPDGPRPLPTNTVVQIAGCFGPGPNDTWQLTAAVAPQRTKNQAKITPDEIKAAQSRPSGKGEIRLNNLSDLSGFSASLLKGHRVLAKGIYINGREADRLNVTALESIANTCAP